MTTTGENGERGERLSATELSRVYKIALLLLAILLTVGQIVIQTALGNQTDASHIVNLSGRQRARSQRICKAILILRFKPQSEDLTARLLELEEVAKDFKIGQDGLLYGSKELGLPDHHSKEIARRLSEINGAYESIQTAADQVVKSKGTVSDASLARVLSDEKQFYAQMEELVVQYDRESTQNVAALQCLEAILLALTLLVIVLEALYIFRPALRAIVIAYNQNVVAKETIEKQVERQSALSSLSREALTQVVLPELINGAAENILTVLKLEGVVVYKVADGDTLNLVASYNAPEAEKMIVLKGELKQAVESLLPNTIDREFKNMLNLDNYSGFDNLVVPVNILGKPAHLLGVLFEKGRNLREDEIEFLHAITNLLGMAMDYAESRGKLEEKTLKLESIITAAPDGIIALSSDGRILSANRAAEKMLRTDEEDLLGASFSDWLMPVSSISSPKDALEKIYAQHNSLVSEFKCKRADGSSFPVEVAMSQVNVTDAPLCTCIIRDITDRKEVERRVSEFYSMVSHELRTPLTSIRGALGLMEGGLAGELSTKASQLVKVARSESERLIRLINDILDIRRLEAGKLELKLAGVETGKLVKSTAEAITGMASEAGIEIDTQIIDGVTIVCDRDRIAQVLTNLVANAIKFSETGSHVSVRLEKKAGDWLRFSVIDEGPGIAEDQIHKLFGKFQQLNSSDGRPKGGSGLGLAITKAIIEEHGGKIGVETEVGHGSTFWFELAIKSEESVPSLKS